MKNNKGFTLIELLAVIIILGVLMLVAIPSVTKYIDNSRKESYLATAKEIVNGAVNKVNSATYDVFDSEATYYLPIECIPSENSKASPYGELKDSYVVFTYDGDGFNYYYTGTDTAKMGIYLTHKDLLEISSIKTGVDKIEPNVSVNPSSKIILLSCDGLKEENDIDLSIDAYTQMSEYDIEDINNINSGNAVSQDTTLARSPWSQMYSFDRDYKVKTEKIAVIRTSSFPENAIRIWDVSNDGNGLVKMWVLDEDNDGMYEIYIGSKRKIYGNPYSRHLFSYHKNLTYIDVSNLDTSKVTDMMGMFSGSSSSEEGANKFTKIIGIENFNTSNVTNMQSMFFACSNLTELNLSRWDTSKVEDMSEMFSGWQYSPSTAITTLDLSNFDLSSVKTMKRMFEWANRLTTIKLGKNKATKLEDTSKMFEWANGPKNIDLSNLKIDASVNTYKMFNGSINSNTAVIVDSETTKQYILSNRDNFGLRVIVTDANFIVK